MFSFQLSKAASPQLQAAAGMKRSASGNDFGQSPKQRRLSAAQSAAVTASTGQLAEATSSACFQLLQVRGIPDWANRYSYHLLLTS